MDKYGMIPYHSPSWKIFSAPHIIFIFIFILSIFATYIFSIKAKKSVGGTYKSKKLYTIFWILFGIQLFCFILYRTNQIWFFNLSKNDPDKLHVFNTFVNIFPTDYCQITQLLSLLIVLIPKNKFFSIVCIYPIIGSTLAIFVPSNGVDRGSYDYWYYYEYFISHILSLVIPFYMFRYGIRRFDKHYFKWSIIYLGLVCLLVTPGNWLLGRADMEITPTFRGGPIDFTKVIHTSDKNFNEQFGGWLNIFFKIFIMGLFGNYLGWLFYRYQKPKYKYFKKIKNNKINNQ